MPTKVNPRFFQQKQQEVVTGKRMQTIWDSSDNLEIMKGIIILYSRINILQNKLAGQIKGLISVSFFFNDFFTDPDSIIRHFT